MIRNTFKFLSVEVRGLHAAAYVLAIMALSSSLLALIRDRLLAHTFGAHGALDVYYASFRIPDLLFVLLGSIVSVYVLIPELARRDPEGERDYLDTIVTGFSIFAVLASVVLALLAPTIIAHLYPSFVVFGSFDMAVHLTRIMLLQPILLGLSNIAAAITQSRHRFVLYSLSPLLYSTGAIIGILFFYPFFGIAGLAWGIVLGAVLHLGVQIPTIARDGFVRMPRGFDMDALVNTVRISLPRAGALSMGQVSFIGLSAIATSLGHGALSVFVFAFNLASVPLSIVGSSYSVAAYPTLAAAIARGDRESFVEHVAAAARAVIFWSLPLTGLMIVLRAHIVRTVLGSGHFDWTDTRLTAALLGILALSLVAQGLLLLLPRGYYAAHRSMVPFLFAAGSAALAIALAWAILAVSEATHVWPWMAAVLRLVDVPGTPAVALGLGLSISSIIGATAMLVHFDRTFGGLISGLKRTLFESVCAALAAGGIAYLALSALSPLSIASTLGTVILQAITAGGAGTVAGLIIFHVLGSREYHEIRATVQARLWRMGGALGMKVVSSAENVEL